MKPSEYSTEAGQAVIDALQSGQEMANIFTQDDMPDRNTFIRWCAEHPIFLDTCLKVETGRAADENDHAHMQYLYKQLPPSEGLPSFDPNSDDVTVSLINADIQPQLGQFIELSGNEDMLTITQAAPWPVTLMTDEIKQSFDYAVNEFNQSAYKAKWNYKTDETGDQIIGVGFTIHKDSERCGGGVFNCGNDMTLTDCLNSMKSMFKGFIAQPSPLDDSHSGNLG